MTPFGMPTSMFLIFVATVVAGSLGAAHFIVWHLILGKPFGDEEDHLSPRDPTGRTAPGRGGAATEGQGGER